MNSDSQTIDVPLRVASVVLAVRDLGLIADFYRHAIGLSVIERVGDQVLLGADGAALLRLVHRPTAPIPRPGGIGLFHTAFLLPSRASLGRWLAHAADIGVTLDGASDHGVSEAVYLTDPEGNGIEVYADRERVEWPNVDGALRMTTQRLRMADVVAAGSSERWTAAPAGTRIGHIHLAVASVDEGEVFYRDVIGFDRMVRLPAASFLSTGGYHHHVALNTWHTAGATPRKSDTTGLLGFTLRAGGTDVVDAVRDRAARTAMPILNDGTLFVLSDPSGIRVEIV